MDPGSPGIVIGLLILSSEVILAMFTNLFIISVNLLNFYRDKMLDSQHKIQLTLKVSNILFTIVVTSNAFSNILQPDLPEWSPSSTVLTVYCMCSSNWLIALQCFYNFIKIVHFPGVFIQWVKTRIDSILPWQIAVVGMVSLCTSLLNLLSCRTSHVSSTNSSCISSTNMTSEQAIINDNVSIFLLIMICAPLVLTIVANLITAAFLQCHTSKMKDTNTSGEVHQYKHAILKMLRLLFLYSVFYLMMFLYYYSVFALYSIGYWINLILVLSFFPTVNVLQILGTPHLRTTWMEMINYFTLCRKT